MKNAIPIRLLVVFTVFVAVLKAGWDSSTVTDDSSPPDYEWGFYEMVDNMNSFKSGILVEFESDLVSFIINEAWYYNTLSSSWTQVDDWWGYDTTSECTTDWVNSLWCNSAWAQISSHETYSEGLYGRAQVAYTP